MARGDIQRFSEPTPHGETIEALHIAAAHSDSDALYRFRKANVVHTGDLFCSAGYPYIDIGNGGRINGMIAAADRILPMTDGATKMIPGHGPMADRTRFAEFRTMLISVRDRMAKMIREKRTLEEVLAAKPTADLDQAWKAGMPPKGFITLVYRDLLR